MKINLKDHSILILIAVNLFPIVGVIIFGWNIFEIVALYVIETIIIGLYNVIKMSFTEGKTKFALIPFFLFHYNFFILIQSIFVVILIGGGTDDLFTLFTNRDFIIAICLIFISHGVSLYKNYINSKKYKTIKAETLMVSPYKRIFVQQFMVIGGAFVVMIFDAPMGFLIILIFLKILIDIRAHNKSHKLNRIS